jgi:hypothetical protein
MGQHLDITVLLGVHLTEEQAKKIADKFADNPDDFSYVEIPIDIEDTYQRDASSIKYGSTPGAKQLVSALHSLGKDSCGTVYYADLLSDDTNASIHSTHYDEGHEHYFGIFVGSKGWGDDVMKLAVCIPQEAINNYDKYVVPILKEFGIEESSTVHLISQVD